MVSKLSWSALLTVSGALGIGVGTMTLLLNQQQGKRIGQSRAIITAINLMKAQEPVHQLLGEPESINVGLANLRDGWTKLEQNNIQVRLPVEGDKDKGYLFAYARKSKKEEPFRLFKMEMTFDKVKGKKLILLDLDEADELDDILAKGVSKENTSEVHKSKQADKNPPSNLDNAKNKSRASSDHNHDRAENRKAN